TGSGWEYGLNGSGKMLYRLPELIAADPKAPVFLVEGEADVEAVRSLGYTATTPGGACDWSPEMVSHLAKRHVIIIPDQDSPGQKAAETWAAALEPVTASLRTLPLPAHDFSDWMRAVGSKEALETLLSAQDDADRAMTFTEWVEARSAQMEWVVDNLLCREGFSLLASKPRVGKSHLARALAVAVSHGTPFMGRVVRQGHVLVCSIDDPSNGAVTHFKTIVSDPTYLHVQAKRPADPVAWLRREMNRQPYELVIIDTLGRFMLMEDMNNYSEFLKCSQPVIDLAREFKTHILATHHMNKGGSDNFDSILGSTGIRGSTEMTILMRKRRSGLRTLETEPRFGDTIEETALLRSPLDNLECLAPEPGNLERYSALTWLMLKLSGGAMFTWDQLRNVTNYEYDALRQAIEIGKSLEWIEVSGDGSRGDPRTISLAGVAPI